MPTVQGMDTTEMADPAAPELFPAAFPRDEP